MAKQLPDLETLRNLLDYNPDTGEIFNKQDGTEAFTELTDQGYLVGYIGGKKYYAHRIAYALHYGCPPNGGVTNLNGIKSDNRAENLWAGSLPSKRIA